MPLVTLTFVLASTSVGFAAYERWKVREERKETNLNAINPVFFFFHQQSNARDLQSELEEQIRTTRVTEFIEELEASAEIRRVLVDIDPSTMRNLDLLAE